MKNILMLEGKIKIITWWLVIMCILVFTIIVIGGLTRLTDSGLSIIEWKPFLGIIPPFSIEEWYHEFNKYKQFPQYKINNFLLTIEDFKIIYWIEFIHRLIGRVILVVYFFPLCFFIVKNYIVKANIWPYLLILLLICAQGVMGWYMVKSGLINNPYISHYRLACHLLLAIIIFSLLFWQLLGMLYKVFPIVAKKFKIIKTMLVVFIILLFIQIFFGALVAGLKAGLVYNTFPYMGESIIPREFNDVNYISFSILNNPVLVQFFHRLFACIIFFAITSICIYSLYLKNNQLTFSLLVIFIVVLIQIIIGITTLIFSVPIVLALFHQLFAIVLLMLLLRLLFLIRSN